MQISPIFEYFPDFSENFPDFPKNRVCVNFEKNLRECVNCEKILRECVNFGSAGGPLKRMFPFPFRYLKRFMTNFHDKPKFAYIVPSDLTHNRSPYVQLADDDLVQFFEFFEKSGHNQNTLLIISETMGTEQAITGPP